MRHGDKNKKFGRKQKVRTAFFRGLARSLFEHGKIETTLARAKAIRPMVDKLVYRAQKDSIASRRIAARRLGSASSAALLFKNTGKKYAERKGGYTRIVRTGFRKSDGAQKAVIELV